MTSMIIAGPGRAGGSLLLAAARAGQEIVGVLSRHPVPYPFAFLAWDAALPPADLLVVAVRDGAIVEVADRLAPQARAVGAAVHLSGAVAVDALAAFARTGLQVGSFHPLQTLPAPERGAEALAGSWVGITAEGPMRGLLEGLAGELGMRPFLLRDENKAAYHAGAASAANYVVEALSVAEDLFAAAAVPFEALRPLVERVVANVFSLGGEGALTGPVARGDWETVRSQLAAAEGVSAELGEQYRLLTQATIHRRYGLSADVG